MDGIEIPDLSNGMDDVDDAYEGAMDFAKDFAASLIPTASNLADMYNKDEESTGVLSEDIQGNATKGGALDWFTRQRLLGRRPSFTAQCCTAPGCTVLHFGSSRFCVMHEENQDELRDKALTDFKLVDDEDVPAAEDTETDSAKKRISNRKSKRAMKAADDMIEKIAIRRKMTAYSEQLDHKDHMDASFFALAKESLTDRVIGKGKLAFFEKPQIVSQFNVLDINGDGLISAVDIGRHIRRINPMWFEGKTPESAEKDLDNYIIEVHPKNKSTLDLAEYARAVIKLRYESKVTGYNGITRCAFWDLRAVVLCYPTVRPSGLLLKRGHAIAYERANAWKRRWFQNISEEECKELTETHNDATAKRNSKKSEDEHDDPLPEEVLPQFIMGYYVNDPSSPTDENGKKVDTTKKGYINLLDVNVVDVSPKTSVKDTMFGSLKGAGLSNLDEMVVFKVTVSTGRRYTLAAPEQEALRWMSYFTWFANAHRAAEQWIDTFGSRKHSTITIRDWALAGTVVAKISLGDVFKKQQEEKIQELQQTGQHVKAKKVKEKFEDKWKTDYEITERDRRLVGIVGLSMASLQDAQNTVITTIKMLVEQKAFFKKFDDCYMFGGVQAGYSAVVALMNAYAYGSMFKNRTRENTYAVKWDSKGEARECSCCGVVFKSMTLRKTTAKHHCRCCGQIVCHTCGSKEVFLEVSGKFERICDSCIITGHPPADRLIISEDQAKKAIDRKSVSNSAAEDKGKNAAKLLFQVSDENTAAATRHLSVDTLTVQEKEAIATRNSALALDSEDVNVELGGGGTSTEAAPSGGGCCIIA